MSADFDRYQHSYRDEVQRSIDFIGQDVDFFVEAKVELLLRIARRRLGPPEGLRVLDLGCGVGLTDRMLEGRVGELYGVDTAAGVVERAAQANPWARYRHYDGRTLPFEDGSFDLSFAICVLHHVEPPARPAFAAEMARVLRPGGLAVVFEHNPYNPLTRVAVNRCDFDEGVVLLSRRTATRLLEGGGLDVVEGGYVIFFPWKHGVFRRVERVLGWLPLGAQYVAAGSKGGPGRLR